MQSNIQYICIVSQVATDISGLSPYIIRSYDDLYQLICDSDILYYVNQVLIRGHITVVWVLTPYMGRKLQA